MADTTVHLAVSGGDDFSFAGAEVPEKIQFGGKQKLVTHEMVGGKRVVDAMGRSDAPLAWSGMLLGQDALRRARYLDYLRISGKQCALTWSEMYFLVVVEEFTADFERFYKIPYHISCTVVQDLAQPITTLIVPSVDDAVRQDVTALQEISGKVNDSKLSKLTADLHSAIKRATSIAQAKQAELQNAQNKIKAKQQDIINIAKEKQAELNGIVQKLQAVQVRATELVAQANIAAGKINDLSKKFPNSTVLQHAAAFANKATAAAQLQVLDNMQNIIGRMQKNLAQIKL